MSEEYQLDGMLAEHECTKLFLMFTYMFYLFFDLIPEYDLKKES